METTDLFKQRMLNIFFPWGYSRRYGVYTGETPYCGSATLVIQIDFDELGDSDSLISIIILSNDYGYEDILGYFKGVMKVACPLLYSEDTRVDEVQNIIDFKLYKPGKVTAYDYYEDGDSYFVPSLIKRITKDQDDEHGESEDNS